MESIAKTSQQGWKDPLENTFRIQKKKKKRKNRENSVRDLEIDIRGYTWIQTSQVLEALKSYLSLWLLNLFGPCNTSQWNEDLMYLKTQK